MGFPAHAVPCTAWKGRVTSNCTSTDGFKDFGSLDGKVTVLWIRKGEYVPNYSWNRAGIEFRAQSSPYNGRSHPYPRVYQIELSYAWPLFVSAACAALAGWRMRRRIPLPGTCPICGYDMRATPDRCPECGAVADGAIA